MKKKIGIVLFVISVIILVDIVIFWYLHRSKLTPEDMLPAGAIATVHFRDIPHSINAIHSNRLWIAISGLDFNVLVKHKIIDPRLAAIIKFFKNPPGGIATTTFLKELFNDEVMIGVYPIEFNFSHIKDAKSPITSKIADELFSSMFIVTRLSPSSEIMTSFPSYIKKFVRDAIVEKLEYKGHDITIIRFNRQRISFSYVKIKNFLILGTGDKAAKMCLDTLTGARQSLSSDKMYRKASKEFLNSASLDLYFNIHGLFSMFKEQSKDIVKWIDKQMKFRIELDSDGEKASVEDVEERIKSIKEELRNVWDKVQGFEALTVSADIDDSLIVKADMLLDKDKLVSVMKENLLCPPTNNKTLNFIPKKVIMYQWSNCVDLASLLSEAANSSSHNNTDSSSATETIKNVVEAKGMYLDEITSVLGDELGGYLFDIEKVDSFYVPEMVFFVKVKDTEKTIELLQKLLENPFISLNDEDYKGYTIKYFVLPLKKVKPAYCIIDDYVLVSINRKLLHMAIDTYLDKKSSLAEYQGNRFSNFHFDDKLRTVQFIRVGNMAERLQGVVEWGIDWVKEKINKQEAFLSGTQKLLDDVKAEADSKREELNKKKKELKKLETMFLNMQEQENQHTTTIKIKIDSLKDDIKTLKSDIEALEDKQTELIPIIQGYYSKKYSIDSQQIVLDKFVYPVLQGLEYVDVAIFNTTLKDDNVMEAMWYVHMR